MTQPKINVRFAPSPTGALHLGGARTAIYNWLYARSQGGNFLLRIEDTDTERSKSEMVDQILRSMKWLGLDWNDEIVYQSQRIDIHKKYIQKLVDSDCAYPCFCTQEMLEKDKTSGHEFMYSGRCRNLTKEEAQKRIDAGEPFTIRFKTPEGITRWEDKVYGKIEVSNEEIDDFIIQRSDGTQTYQLAVVCDDIDMKISHIIRGEDHISNTPKQIRLYLALGLKPPHFAHLPLLLGEDGKRLSKRHGATGVDEYKAMGFPSQAVFNYLALLGWAPKSGQEILERDSIIKQFSLKGISRKAAVFDIQKLHWISDKHISGIDTNEIYEFLKPELKARKWLNQDESNQQYIIHAISLLQSRLKTYKQFFEWGRYFFEEPENYDSETAAKRWPDSSVNEKMMGLAGEFKTIQDWNEQSIEQRLRQFADYCGYSAGELIHPLRLALTGTGVSPSLFEIAEMLGKEIVINRLNRALALLPG